jgi:hypothetical protein
MIDRAATARHKNKLETLRDFIQIKLPMRPVSRVAAREPSARAYHVPAVCRQVVGLQVWIVRGSIGVALDGCSRRFRSMALWQHAPCRAFAKAALHLRSAAVSAFSIPSSVMVDYGPVICLEERPRQQAHCSVMNCCYSRPSYA